MCSDDGHTLQAVTHKSASADRFPRLTRSLDQSYALPASDGIVKFSHVKGGRQPAAIGTLAKRIPAIRAQDLHCCGVRNCNSPSVRKLIFSLGGFEILASETSTLKPFLSEG